MYWIQGSILGGGVRTHIYIQKSKNIKNTETDSFYCVQCSIMPFDSKCNNIYIDSHIISLTGCFNMNLIMACRKAEIYRSNVKLKKFLDNQAPPAPEQS